MQIGKTEIRFGRIFECFGVWMALNCFFLLPLYYVGLIGSGIFVAIFGIQVDEDTLATFVAGVFICISALFLVGFLYVAISDPLG